MTVSEPIIEIIGVTKKYEGFSLGPINLKVQRGQIVGLMGENGAGKTTLLSIMINRRPLEEGIVRLCGKPVAQSLDDVGFAFDCNDFHGNFSLKELNTYLQRIYSTWDNNLFWSKLDELGISSTKRIEQMSRGTKTKAMLAVALSHHPKIIILDEITSGLDPSVRQQVLRLLRTNADTNKTAIVFSTHIPDDIQMICDSVFILKQGKEIVNDSISNVMRSCEARGLRGIEGLMLSLAANEVA